MVIGGLGEYLDEDILVCILCYWIRLLSCLY